MQAMGATQWEIDDIRRHDRKAQGVTEKMEKQAETAISKRYTLNGITVVRLPHDKCSPVTDRLFTEWPDGKENLIILCFTDGKLPEINYFGRGDICKAMKEKFADVAETWGGGKGYGDPSANAFAGCRTISHYMVVDFIVNFKMY